MTEHRLSSAVRLLALAGACVFAVATVIRAGAPELTIILDRVTMPLSSPVAGVAFTLLAAATVAHVRGAAAGRLAVGAALTAVLMLLAIGFLGWDPLVLLAFGYVAITPVSGVYAVLAWRDRALGDFGAAALVAGGLGLTLSAYSWGTTQDVFHLAFALGWAAFGWSATPTPQDDSGIPPRAS